MEEAAATDKTVCTRLLDVALKEGPFCIIVTGTNRTVASLYGGELNLFQNLDNLADFVKEGPRREQVICVVPFCQIKEKGFCARSNGEKLISLTVNSKDNVQTQDLIETIENVYLTEIKTVEGREPTFTPNDEAYKKILENIFTNEISAGEGSSFVVPRVCSVDLENFNEKQALTIFRNLLLSESGFYWAFLFYDGSDRWFIGASPEKHLLITNRSVCMTAISGTYRKPENYQELLSAPLATRMEALKGFEDFLQDEKEINELFMVTDEELKMMCLICPDGGFIEGPILREMKHLIHTEFNLIGKWTDNSCKNVIENNRVGLPEEKRLKMELLLQIKAFRQSMFAATVTGSPMGNACKRLLQYEQSSRGYYSGALLMLGVENTKNPFLDSCIIIRTMEFCKSTGKLEMRVGATLVRNSDPISETYETRCKLNGLVNSLMRPPPKGFPFQPVASSMLDEMNVDSDTRSRWTKVLMSRISKISSFWMKSQADAAVVGDDISGGEGKLLGANDIVETPGPFTHVPDGSLCRMYTGLTALVINNEDDFSLMLGHMLTYLGMQTRLVNHNDIRQLDMLNEYNLVVVGAGPGDPRDLTLPKIKTGRAVCEHVMKRMKTVPEVFMQGLLGVCLGHQILASVLGIPIKRKDFPTQGVQIQATFLEEDVQLGFYNSFVADGSEEARHTYPKDWDISITTNEEILAMRSRRIFSCQFHPESLLTFKGLQILNKMLQHIWTPHSIPSGAA